MTTNDVFGNQSFLSIPTIASRQGLGGWVPDRRRSGQHPVSAPDPRPEPEP
jgi:hypothetical protein